MSEIQKVVQNNLSDEAYERRSIGASKGGAANNGVKKSKQHGEKQRIAQFTLRMRECECGLKTNAGTIARHQNASGHGFVSQNQ
jgi:hypothetical protein